MIKYFCNKCGNELLQSEHYQCEIRVKGFSRIASAISCHYCEDCLAEIIGNESLYEIKRLENERKERVEERKRQSLTTQPRKAVRFDQETIDKAIQSIQKLAEVIVDVWQKIVEAVTNVLNTFWEALRGFFKQVNPKIYNLAYHHKKHRVRKKNKKRLFFLFRR